MNLKELSGLSAERGPQLDKQAYACGLTLYHITIVDQETPSGRSELPARLGANASGSDNS